MNQKARIIAFYLPQYHPTPHNDEWWGKGFTEWTNVGKAKPLFKGHYQPKIPADLGYYDLRLPIIREQQAEMARGAGINAFCYYHYWFGDGHEELDMPFKDVIKTGKPDFPFCLCWANESWHAKFWNFDGSSSKKLLVEQKYLGKEDNEIHFRSLLTAFKDKRYYTYNGKPIFIIYRPLEFENIGEFIMQWNDLAQKHGLPGFHFVAHCLFVEDIQKSLDLGFDAVNLLRLNNFSLTSSSKIKKHVISLYHKIFNKPYIYKYEDIINKLIGEEEKLPNVYPSIVPNWDHTPRSGRKGYLLQDPKPSIFKKHLESVLQTIKSKEEENKIIFLKSWNEWGEGNYVEPDLKYGYGYLNVIHDCLMY